MKKLYITVACMLLILAGGIIFINNKEKKEFVKDTCYLLNTVVEQKWYGKNREKTINEVYDALSEFENKFSSYIKTSEISVINSMAGIKPVAISDETYHLLKKAKEYSLKSQNCFDITILPLVELWGITSQNPNVPQKENIDKMLKLVGAENLILKEDENGSKTAFLKEKGMGLDLGGIAKGFAVDMVKEIAEKNKVKGYVSLGGNLMVIGKKPNGDDMKFGVRNPRGSQNEYIGIVDLDGYTMATTGDYERFFVDEKGDRYHHVLDLKTGYPTDKGLISVTVISKNGGLADCMSTWIFNDGLDNLGKYLNQDEFYIIAVDDELNIYVSPAYKDKFIFEDASGKFSMKDYNIG